MIMCRGWTLKIWIIFRQIAALDAEEEKQIIESIEKEFDNQAIALPVEQATEKVISEDVVTEKLNRLNLMFENENVSIDVDVIICWFF